MKHAEVRLKAKRRCHKETFRYDRVNKEMMNTMLFLNF